MERSNPTGKKDTKGKSKRIRNCIVTGLIGVSLLLFFILGFYRGLRVTRLEYRNAKIPKEFDGYKIVQISDLHCAEFGEGQSELIRCITEEVPDLIAITGDMYDKRQWNYNRIRKLLEGIRDIAPIYAVTGNNEYDDQDMYDVLMDLYQEYNVTLLSDECYEIERGDSKINLYGMYYRDYFPQKKVDMYGEPNRFNLLLYHNPNHYEQIAKAGYDLILTGHTHGGIIRIPFVGGVVGNSKELFPKYDYGMYHIETCDMYITTGLGDLELPRFYNRPEVVSIVLRAQ